MATVYITPDGTTADTGIGRNGCATAHLCVNNGINGGSPNDGTYLLSWSDTVRFSFPTPDLEGGSTSAFSVWIRYDPAGGNPISASTVNMKLYTDHPGEDKSTTAVLTFGGIRNLQYSAYEEALTEAQLSNIEVQLILNDPLNNSIAIYEVELEITYEPAPEASGPANVAKVTGIDSSNIASVGSVTYENIKRIGGVE